MKKWTLVGILGVWLAGGSMGWAAPAPDSSGNKPPARGASRQAPPLRPPADRRTAPTGRSTLPSWPAFGAKTLSLPTLLTQARASNPTLVQLRRQVEVVRQREVQTGRWPDLQVGVEASNFPLPTFNPGETAMSGIQYNVIQRFPILRRLGLQRSMARLNTSMMAAVAREKVPQVVWRVRKTLYDLMFLRKAWKTERELYNLTGQAAEVARTKYTVGKASQQNMLQAFTLQAQIRNQMLGLAAKARMLRFRLQQLLGVKALRGKVGAFRDPKPPASLAQAMQRAWKQRGIVTRWNLQRKQSRVLLKLARANYWPDVSVKLGIRQRFANPVDNGRPFLSLGLSLALPTWGNPARQGLAKEAMARHQAAASQLRVLRTQFREQLQVQLTLVQQYDRQIQVFQRQILPLAEQTYRSALSGYQVDRVDFLTLLSNLRTWFKEKLRRDRLRVQRAIAIARIQAIMGAQSPTVPRSLPPKAGKAGNTGNAGKAGGPPLRRTPPASR